jgi:hypothetical protein
VTRPGKWQLAETELPDDEKSWSFLFINWNKKKQLTRRGAKLETELWGGELYMQGGK